MSCWCTTLRAGEGVRLGDELLALEMIEAELSLWRWRGQLVALAVPGMVRLGDALVEGKVVKEGAQGRRLTVCVDALEEMKLERV